MNKLLEKRGVSRICSELLRWYGQLNTLTMLRVNGHSYRLSSNKDKQVNLSDK